MECIHQIPPLTDQGNLQKKWKDYRRQRGWKTPGKRPSKSTRTIYIWTHRDWSCMHRTFKAFQPVFSAYILASSLVLLWDSQVCEWLDPYTYICFLCLSLCAFPSVFSLFWCIRLFFKYLIILWGGIPESIPISRKTNHMRKEGYLAQHDLISWCWFKLR